MCGDEEIVKPGSPKNETPDVSVGSRKIEWKHFGPDFIVTNIHSPPTQASHIHSVTLLAFTHRPLGMLNVLISRRLDCMGASESRTYRRSPVTMASAEKLRPSGIVPIIC